MSDKVVNFPRPNPELVERVNYEMAYFGLSQNAVAKQIGISATQLSQWRSGKYPAAIEGIEEAVKKWVRDRDRQQAIKSRLPEIPMWVETPSGRQIMGAFMYAKDLEDIAVVFGGAGAGKTTTARHFAESAPNAWHVTMSASSASVLGCLLRVAEAVGIKNPRGSSYRVESEIRESIQFTNGVLIIDEAQHLTTRSLEELRAIHDATRVGMVLMGNETVYSRLTGGQRQAEFAQLFSRIGVRLRLDGATLGDIEAIAKAWGVTDPEIINALSGYASLPGAIRGATKVLRLATQAAEGKPVTLNLIRAAQRNLGGKV